MSSKLLRLFRRRRDRMEHDLARELQFHLDCRVAELTGTRPPRLVLSAKTAKLLFRVLAPLLRATGRRLPVPLEQLDSLRRHWHFDDTRARSELGWNSRPLDEGLVETLAYLQRQDASRAVTAT